MTPLERMRALGGAREPPLPLALLVRMLPDLDSAIVACALGLGEQPSPIAIEADMPGDGATTRRVLRRITVPSGCAGVVLDGLAVSVNAVNWNSTLVSTTPDEDGRRRSVSQLGSLPRLLDAPIFAARSLDVEAAMPSDGDPTQFINATGVRVGVRGYAIKSPGVFAALRNLLGEWYSRTMVASATAVVPHAIEHRTEIRALRFVDDAGVAAQSFSIRLGALQFPRYRNSTTLQTLWPWVMPRARWRGEQGTWVAIKDYQAGLRMSPVMLQPGESVEFDPYTVTGTGTDLGVSHLHLHGATWIP